MKLAATLSRRALFHGDCAAIACATFVFLSLMALQPAVGVASPEEVASGARARLIESRLRAPCCWNQTLDIHDSEVTRALHGEIAARVAQGEAADAIENDLVARYGERIRAVPQDSALPTVALGTLLVIMIAGIGIWLAARSWRPLRVPANDMRDGSPGDAAMEDAYDARIDRELAEL